MALIHEKHRNVVELLDRLVTDLHVGTASEVDKMFVKVSRWKVSGTNKFMTSSNFDEFRTCEMCVHFHLLVFEFDCLPSNK